MILTLLGCLLTPSEVDDLRAALMDQDQDGTRALAHGGLDCDDTNELVHPGAEELCDGLDNDCDGSTDEDFYVDSDQDGAVSSDPSGVCAPGRTAQKEPGDDGNDADPGVFPGAYPDCRGGVDLNCNGVDDADDPYDGDLEMAASPNFRVTAAIQVADTDRRKNPGAWTDIGSYLTENGANNSGLVNVSTTVDGKFWVRFGVGVMNSSGTALERGAVSLTVSARS